MNCNCLYLRQKVTRWIGQDDTLVNKQKKLYEDEAFCIISRLSTSVWGAQTGNNKMEYVMETKLLDFNLDKSCVIVMGSKKKKAENESQSRDNPLKLCGKEIKCVPMKNTWVIFLARWSS